MKKDFGCPHCDEGKTVWSFDRPAFFVVQRPHVVVRALRCSSHSDRVHITLKQMPEDFYQNQVPDLSKWETIKETR